MSREFGEYCQCGYFHDRIDSCIDDLRTEGRENSAMWIPLLKEFHKVAYALSSFEAHDWSEANYILQMIKSLPVLKKELEKIEKRIGLYESVMKEFLNKTLTENKP
jgi:hypothetical protein